MYKSILKIPHPLMIIAIDKLGKEGMYLNRKRARNAKPQVVSSQSARLHAS